MIAPTSSTHMAPAKIHALRSERTGPAGGVSSPAGRPQRWQNRARGESWAPHSAQPRGARLAPQLLQKRPLAGSPQAGQVVVGVVIAAGR
jgi:hypothetical protein